MKSGGSGQAIALLIFLANSLDRNQDSVTTETLLLLHLPLIAGSRWCTPANLLGWDITENTAAGTNYGIRSHLDAWANEAICSDPDAVANSNCRCHQIECWVLDIMTTSTEVGFLRNNAMTSKANLL
jgi:hypothetical protein